MKKKTLSFFMFLPIAVVSVIAFNNCAQGLDTSEGEFEVPSSLPPHGGSSGGGMIGSGGTQNFDMPYALLSAEQTKVSMLNLTGVTTCSALNAEYNRRYSTLAAGNSLSLANGPLLIGSISLAGQICSCLYDKEAAISDGQRAFYNGVNFSGGLNVLSDGTYQDIIQRMARVYWARAVTDEELSALLAFRTEFTGATSSPNNATATKNFLNANCAAMLSSIDTISY